MTSTSKRTADSEAAERWPWLEDRQTLEPEPDSGNATVDIPPDNAKWFEQNQDAVARLVHLPHYRNASAAAAFGGSSTGKTPNVVESTKLVTEQCRKAADGDLRVATDLLTSQALTLDAVFTEMLARAGKNLGDYPEAAERYMRMAMKAQGQCRTTVEALSKLARGGEQIVKHIHIDNRGGQAVVTDTMTTGGANAGGAEQPHAIANAHVTALPSQDPFGHGVPIGGNEERSLSHARRDIAGRADR